LRSEIDTSGAGDRGAWYNSLPDDDTLLALGRASRAVAKTRYCFDCESSMQTPSGYESVHRTGEAAS
jgi:hypothetical protein